MRRWAALLGAVALSGCVTSQMTDGLGFLVGQDINAAVERIGYPSSERAFNGDTIYTWSTSQNGVIPMSTTSSTAGMVGSVPVWGSTTTTSMVPVNYNCTIELATGPDKTIKSWQWSGNMGGCMRYARALRR